MVRSYPRNTTGSCTMTAPSLNPGSRAGWTRSRRLYDGRAPGELDGPPVCAAIDMTEGRHATRTGGRVSHGHGRPHHRCASYNDIRLSHRATAKLPRPSEEATSLYVDAVRVLRYVILSGAAPTHKRQRSSSTVPRLSPGVGLVWKGQLWQNAAMCE